MRYFYFSIFFVILLLIFGLLFYFNRQFLKFSENAISADLQANLLAIKDNEIRIKNNLSEEKPINLLFVGDIMLDRGVGSVVSNYNNYRYPFLKTFEILETADLTFGNLEGSISKNGKKQGSIYSFRFDPVALEGLKFAGFDVLSLANNHILDYGREAMENTISILKENNIVPIGAGKNQFEANNPIISEINNTKIAFLAYADMNPKGFEAGENYSGISSFELEQVINKIKEIKTLGVADIVIISFHWGEEYENRSNKNQQKLGRALAEAGADLIIGHHPHVVQEVELYPSSPSAASEGRSKNSWIAYSLGNFIFDQNFSKETMKGLMIKAKIQNKKIVEIEPIEIKINDSFQPEAISL
ncbi:hypothetical protein A2999_01115 [Candidatus Wolfebacteria bacterium RIFCSPLOWO2_01_FULL_38_11]|uniref:Poly-gamma-glutamate biosynthesis protein n=2 Tax=Candidatus Wolfeibacteriota TaxID=1752735 RepID=A0A0G0J3D0_9BACT|nr:MAG: poly-gamma-glutamate biosynthesis protein [Candidatus Wolfebacteria bacterium GW2011_GWC1_37_10]OGM91121.1 MAG: hypothetical protein A2999_01115 [Candidatus Wolfebacteria bacterium RIFCSPLOWO2_01_FULL_38_11]